MTAMISDYSSGAYGKGKAPARSGGEQISGEIRDICARLRLAQADQPAAVLTPVPDDLGSDRVKMAAAFLLGAIARDVLGDPEVAERALHALDLAGPGQALVPLLSHPRSRPTDRYDRYPSAHGTAIGQTANLLAGPDGPASPPRTPGHHLQALTHGESRVLRYLPTNLSAREIADELYLSANTVKTHQRHLYQKLGAHNRSQAVAQARALGLLAS